MSICKDQFINALEDVVSKEFKDIPYNEGDIEYSFSRKFNLKMQKLIKNQKKSYWKFINTASKRVAIICIAIISLLCGMLCIEPIRVSAIEAIEEIIIKTKKIDIPMIIYNITVPPITFILYHTEMYLSIVKL